MVLMRLEFVINNSISFNPDAVAKGIENIVRAEKK
jgi:hypothetical protein